MITIALLAAAGAILAALSRRTPGPEPLTSRPRLGVTKAEHWAEDIDFDWPER